MQEERSSEKAKFDVSLVIPAYNEETRLAPTLENLARFFSQKPFSVEVLVVDDGSNDDTKAVAKGFGDKFENLKVLRNEPNRGKGYSVKRGMLEALGKIRVFYDADGSTPIEELDRALEWHKKGYDLVIGSRALSESVLDIAQPFHRRVAGTIFRSIVSFLTVPGIRDTQCGFKCFTAKATTLLFPMQKMERWSFDAEILFLAWIQKMRIKEMAVTWRDSDETRLNFLTDGPRMIYDLLLIRIYRLFGKYKLS